MSQTFRLSLPVRFADCDPAGIGYYPRYFEMCDAAIEDWTEKVLGCPRRILHLELKLGLPTVDLRARFSAPSRLGDSLDLDVSVVRIGRSSIDLSVSATCEGQGRFDVDFTQVLTSLETMRGKPWPPEWRERLMMFAEKETSA